MRELRPRAGKKTFRLRRGGFAAPAKFLRHSRQNTRSRNFPREERPQNIRRARALSGENRAEGEVMKRGKPAR